MTQLNDTLNKVLKSLDGAWIKCPLCGDEYNKLRPCSYIFEGKTVGTHVCVVCAESVQSIEKVFDFMGIDGIGFHSRQRRKPYDDLSLSWGDHWDNAKTIKIRVENINPAFVVEVVPESDRLRSTHVEAKTTIMFDNIFQVASWFKKLVNETKNTVKIERKGWGND